MANISLVREHTHKWEGGLSSDTRDTALKSGHSGVKNPKTGGYYHTNKGIVWKTYVTYCNRVGKTPNPNEFIKMPDKLWDDIAYSLYWKPNDLDNVNCQPVAEIIFEAYWGGGGHILVRDMQRKLADDGFLGANKQPLVIDGAMGKNTTYALNNATKTLDEQEAMVKYLTDQRFRYLKSLSSWSWAGKGWSNRVNDLYAKSMKYLSVQGLLGTLVTGGLFFLIYKKFFKKG